MPPKKLQQQRKKQKTVEASSSGAQSRVLLSTQDYAKERKKKLQKLEFMNTQYLDWVLLEEYGMQERIQQLVEDKTWFKLFELKEPAYKNLTIEFLSTMKIENDGVQSTLTFQAYGEVHKIILKQIGVLLGFYEHENDVMGLPNSWPDEMDAETFWAQIIQPRKDDFVPSKSLSTTFAAVEHKLLHHILAHTICCKKTSHSKVTSFDMFYLYSMISGYKIDLGVELASFMDRQISDTRTRLIFCGGYITALLKGMGIFQQPEGDEGIPCKKISAAPFRTWGLSKEPNRVDPDEETIAPQILPAEIASSSHPPPPVSEFEQLRQEIRELREEHRQERRKNKKFRSQLFDMLKSAISCFHPSAAEKLQYQTSSDEAGSTEPES